MDPCYNSETMKLSYLHQVKIKCVSIEYVKKTIILPEVGPAIQCTHQCTLLKLTPSHMAHLSQNTLYCFLS